MADLPDYPTAFDGPMAERSLGDEIRALPAAGEINPRGCFWVRRDEIARLAARADELEELKDTRGMERNMAEEQAADLRAELDRVKEERDLWRKRGEDASAERELLGKALNDLERHHHVTEDELERVTEERDFARANIDRRVPRD